MIDTSLDAIATPGHIAPSVIHDDGSLSVVVQEYNQNHGADGKFSSTGDAHIVVAKDGTRSLGQAHPDYTGSGTSSSSLSAEQRVQAVEQHLAEKYPHTQFELSGMHPDTAEAVGKQLDKLMTQYADAGRSLAYIGTGQNAPKGYQIDLGHDRPAGVLTNQKDPNGYNVMHLNPQYFGDPSAFHTLMGELQSESWLAKGTYSPEGIVTHEFGHALNFQMAAVGQSKTPFGYNGWQGQGTMPAAFEALLGSRWTGMGKANPESAAVSPYAATQPAELFAESFASMHFTPQSEQAPFVSTFRSFLNDTIPGGSTSHWTATPSPTKLTPDQSAQWDTFASTYSYSKKG